MQKTNAATETKPSRILVIDDEPDLGLLIRNRFRKKIRQKEYEFVFASNGSVALDKLQANQDIIRAAMNRGAFDLLTKPIDFNDFELTVEKTLQQVARLEEGRRQHENADSSSIMPATESSPCGMRPLSRSNTRSAPAVPRLECWQRCLGWKRTGAKFWGAA